MRIGIFYFTGTGNTEFVARELQTAFGSEHPTELFNIELLDAALIDDQLARFDVLGFGAPVHIFNAAKEFRRFLRQFPSSNGTPAFIFANAGGGALGAVCALRATLTKKGYLITNEAEFATPGNVALTGMDQERGELQFNLFGYRETQNIKQMLDNTHTAAHRFAQRVVQGEAGQLSPGLGARLASALGKPLLDWWVCAIVMRWYLHSTRDCSLCGTCLDACPTRNIRIDRKKIKFGRKCTICYRCINVCPKQAIQLRWPAGSLMGNKFQYLLPGWKPPQHADRQCGRSKAEDQRPNQDQRSKDQRPSSDR